MTQRALAAFCLFAALASVAGCRDRESLSGDANSSAPTIAASNSFLECAVTDLLGASTPILRLAEPGMCPVHAGVRPSQVAALSRCRVLFRMDFQKSLDAKVARACEEGLHIAEVRIPGGLCEPESYLAACRQIAGALGESKLIDPSLVQDRLSRITQRVQQTVSQCRQDVSSIGETPVVASVRQEAFCQWLGLRVIATFQGADVESTRRLDEALRAGRREGVQVVVANLPEGRRVADFLAKGLKARVVVFGNFPALGRDHECFDDLVRDNVARLLEAVGE
jgi:ABC-type Zn uptake system ZnuABC Zn-binding protein ZnuA